MDNKSKIDKIQEVLEEGLGLQWYDNTVRNYMSKGFHTAGSCDFCNNKSTYVYMIDKKKTLHLAKVVLNDTKFIVEIDGVKVNLSQHWQELNTQDTVVREQ